MNLKLLNDTIGNNHQNRPISYSHHTLADLTKHKTSIKLEQWQLLNRFPTSKLRNPRLDHPTRIGQATNRRLKSKTENTKKFNIKRSHKTLQTHGENASINIQTTKPNVEKTKRSTKLTKTNPKTQPTRQNQPQNNPTNPPLQTRKTPNRPYPYTSPRDPQNQDPPKT
jgi:hypothetical protein